METATILPWKAEPLTPEQLAQLPDAPTGDHWGVQSTDLSAGPAMRWIPGWNGEGVMTWPSLEQAQAFADALNQALAV